MKFALGQKRKHPLYWTWRGMLQRCSSTLSTHYLKYRARGITVCERWKDFGAFLDDMGDRPSSQHSIERINNDGNYEQSNCCWATKTAQARNRRYARPITFAGRTQLLSDWAKELGINISTLSMRLDTYKWPLERALRRKHAV